MEAGRGKTESPPTEQYASKSEVQSTKQGLAFLAEDDYEMRRLLRGILKKNGYEVKEAESGKVLIEALQSERAKGTEPALIVSDNRMPHITGLQILHKVRQWGCTAPFILITAFGDEETTNEASRLEATIMINKPFEISDFETIVKGII